MTIRDGLAVDHIYVSILDNDFEDLRALLDGQPAIIHEKVTAGDDHWEGVYAYSRAGAYFEFLKGSDLAGGLGIAASAYITHGMDARKLRDELPDLPWQSGSRTTGNGDPWFDFLSLGDYLHHKTTLFNAWIMHYHPYHRVPTGPRVWRAIDAFSEVQVVADPKMKEEIQAKGCWLPGTVQIRSDEAILILPDRDGGQIKVRVTFRDGVRGFQLKSLAWWPSRGATWVPARSGPWELLREGNQMNLAYRGT